MMANSSGPILGLISPLDCFIHIKVSRDDEAAWTSTAIHELVHYLQFIATPVGCQVRTRQQWLAFDMALYLHNQQQPVAMGNLGSVLLDDSVLPRDATAARLRERWADCILFNKPFITREALAIYDTCFPSPGASDEEAYNTLRMRRPLEVDVKRGCFFLKGSHLNVPVAANCIMEYMARLVQLRSEGKFQTPEALFHAVRDRDRVHYHLPLLLLIQEGILDNPFGWPHLFRMLMTLMQTALLIDPLALPEELHDRLGGEFLPQSLFLKALLEPEMFDCMFFAILAFGSSSEGPADTSARAPHKAYADFLLKSVGWPSVAELLDIFAKDIGDNIDLATNKGRARETLDRAVQAGIRLPKAFWESREQGGLLGQADMRGGQFRKFRELCFQLWEHDKNIVEPVHLLANAPYPIIAELKDGGIATSCSDENQTFWDVNYELGITLNFHLCQKILFAKDLACYSDPFGQTAQFDCPFLDECVLVPRKSKLEFCVRDAWKDLVNNFLRGSELQLQ